MSLTLHYHPFSRAAGSLWALEEAGQPYQIAFHDMMKGEHKAPALVQLNPMGKLPTLQDSGPDGQERTVVTEAGAIALYLADRYAPERLAPALDDPDRATYLRWSFFAPSVIEPGLMAKQAAWEFKPATVGWGDHSTMLDAMQTALEPGPWLLSERFTMADVVFGGTIRWMLRFGMLEQRPSFLAYAERLGERPANQRADEINAEWRKKLGLDG